MSNAADTPAPGYKFTAAQAQALRVEFVEKHLLPAVRGIFHPHPLLKSALMCVGQFWCDEAYDAVHAEVIFSELDEPDFDAARSGDYYDDDSPPPPDPNVPNTTLSRNYGERGGSTLSDYDLGLPWDDNSGSIPLWAAFAPEGGSQEYDRIQEVYAPAVLVRRDGTYEFHDMQRPWLDGIMPEWEQG